jgi:hypothetical protein
MIEPDVLLITALQNDTARCDVDYNILQLITLDEVNTTIYQPQRSDYHRGHWPR